MAAQNSLKKNAALNIIKQICSIIFPMVTFPYAVRVLGAEKYGTITYCSSIVTYFSLFAALGLQNYGVREGARIRNEKEKLSRLANQLFTINIFTTSLALFAFFLMLINVQELSRNKYVLLIQMMIIPFSLIGCEWINIVFEDYTYITIRYLILQVISIIALFVFVHDSDDYLYYAGITTFAQAGAGLFNVFYIRNKYIKIKPVLHDLNFIEHIKALLILFGVTISSYIYINADTTMIGAFRGDLEVGLYGSATKIYNLAKMVINATVVATIPRISAYLGENNRAQYNALINKVIAMTGVLVLPSAVGMCLLAKPILVLICGYEYIDAYVSLGVLGISLLFAPMAYIYSSGVLVSNKKEKVFLYASIAGAALNVILNFLIIPKLGYTGAAFTTLLSEVVVFIITRTVAIRLFEAEKKKWLIDSALGCVGIIVVCMVGRLYIHNYLIECISSISLSVVVYAIVLIMRGNEQVTEMLSIAKKIIEKVTRRK